MAQTQALKGKIMTETNENATIEEKQVEDPNVQVTTPEDDTEYSAHEQQLDQERGNARRAREELSSVSGLLESANAESKYLRAEMDELKKANSEEKSRLEAAQQAEQDKLDEMDPELVDQQVIKNIQVIEKRLQSQSDNFRKEKTELLSLQKGLSDKLAKLEDERADTQRKSANNEARESVLSRVEASLKLHGVTTPGQYRTEAMKIADDMVDNGQRTRPDSLLKGVELLEECYLKVIDQHSKKKKNVSVDGGSSGVSSGVKSTAERKTGSLDEVKADMLKDKSWQED